MTQLKLAGELDFGMSCISTIEAGHAYANIGRTLLLLRRLHLEAGICLSAITAQANIHFHLVVDFQTVGRAIATLDPSWNQSTIPYLSIVADTGRDTRDHVPESLRRVQGDQPTSLKSESYRYTHQQ